LVQSVKNWRQRCGGMSVGGQRWLRRATTLDPPGRDARCNFRCRRLSNAVRFDPPGLAKDDRQEARGPARWRPLTTRLVGAPSQQASYRQKGELFREPRRSLLRRLRQRFISDCASAHSSVLWDELVRRRSVSCRTVRRLWHALLLQRMRKTPLATSVYNPPSDPVTKLPKALAISVVHNHQTRLVVLSDVGGFLGIGINLDHAAGGRPSTPIEGQSALYFAAGRAFKCMMLIARHHHGVVPNCLHQMHLSAAGYTTHRAYSLPITSVHLAP
jgi:hypothetical protein